MRTAHGRQNSLQFSLPWYFGMALPADLTIDSCKSRDDHLAGTLFEGKVIFEKTYGHATYGCMVCCDDALPWLSFNPLGIPFSATAPNGVQSRDCNNNPEDVSTNFYYNWSTLNSAIATVGVDGTHTGVAVGSTTSNAYGPLLVALIATAFSFFRETFLSRVLIIDVWLIAVVVWVLVKVKD